MKTLRILLATLLLSVCAHAQAPTGELKIDTRTKRINESFKVPSGKTLTIESGGTLDTSSGNTSLGDFGALEGTFDGLAIFNIGFQFGDDAARNVARDALATDRAVYLSTAGNDSNAGTRAAPLLTSAAALSAINNNGEIVLLAGDYTGLKFNLASAKNVTIRSEPSTIVRVYLGETISSGFTADTSNVYFKTITTAIPAAADSIVWVFEDSTAEGTITAAHPLQRGRATRLDHTRLTVAPSLAALRSGANGRYFFTGTTLYIKATDAANLASAPKTYRIPSQTANQSFTYGGTATADITIRGVQVFYGKDNFDLSGVSRFRLENCLGFGGGNEGLLANNFGSGEDVHCEWAANANDGAGTGNLTTGRISTHVSTDSWFHDNGDEGLSAGHGVSGEALHFLTTTHGGLFENNARGGGITSFQSRLNAHSPRTRANLYGINPGGVDQVDVYGLVSTGDAYGCFLSGGTGSVCNLWTPTIMAPTTAVTSAGPNGVINSYYPSTDSPTLMHGGAGTVNVAAKLWGETATVDHLATSGTAVQLNMPHTTENLSVMKIRAHNNDPTVAFTDLNFGYNSSANMTVGSSRGLVLTAGGNNNLAFLMTNATKFLMRDNGNFQIVSPTVPGSATATGTAGEIAWDASYIYVCTATNTWKRVAIATW